MWRQRPIVSFLILATCGSVLAVLIATSSDEPRYNGRKYRDWVPLIDQTNATAEKAIRDVGTNGIPVLLELIEHGPSRLDVLHAAVRYLFGGRKTEYWAIGFLGHVLSGNTIVIF